MRRAASSMSRSVSTGIPASAAASGRFGVTTYASGRISRVRASRASACNSGSPDFAIITGSTTIFPGAWARSLSATLPMIADVDSMPIFTASAPKSDSTASICRATKSGGRFRTPCTPREFWAVMAVRTDIPNTENAENVLRSAWMPAPPPESDPAMVSAFGTAIDLSSIRAGGDALKPARLEPLLAGQRGLHLLEHVEILLQAAHVVLHFQDRRAELRGGAERATRLPGLFEYGAQALRVGTALVDRATHIADGERAQNDPDHR